MIRLTFALRRLTHLSLAEFQDHWRGPHRDIMIRNKAALGYCRYVQSHRIEGPLAERIEGSRGGPAPFDGTAEVWWESLDAFERSLSSPEGRAAGRELLEDEKRFIDLANSPVWLSEEAVIEEG